MSEAVPLHDLVELRADKVAGAKDPQLPYVGMEHVAQNGGEIFGSAPSASSVSINSIFASGDILFGKLRPNLRKCVQTTFSGYCSTDLLVFRAKTGADSGFAARVLQSDAVFSEALRTAEGTKMPRTSWSALRGLGVFRPPIGEQRRIAEILDTVDGEIRMTERLIAKLEMVKQGLLQDVLTRGIDDRGCVRASIGGYHELPNRWEWLSLEDLGAPVPYAIVDGPFGSNLKSVHYRSSGIPVIQSGFVTSQHWAPSEYVYVDEALFHEQYRSAVQPGDIVMAKIGATCGACAVVPDNHPVGILAGNSLKITVDETRCLREYLVLVLHRYFETGELNLIRTETAQPAISLGRLRRLPVRLPPLTEQNRIVAVATAAERRTADESAHLLKLQQLKQGLMDDLLVGRVRVAVGEDAP